MRDIREDIKERIRAEHAKREPHQDALKQIDENVATLERLLTFEESRASGNGSARATMPRPAASLVDYVFKMLKKGPKSLDELSEAAVAAGYFEDEKGSPGRIIHGKLINPMRYGTVRKDDEGRYEIT